jgi:hypothetical protein
MMTPEYASIAHSFVRIAAFGRGTSDVDMSMDFDVDTVFQALHESQQRQ